MIGYGLLQVEVAFDVQPRADENGEYREAMDPLYINVSAGRFEKRIDDKELIAEILRSALFDVELKACQPTEFADVYTRLLIEAEENAEED